MPKGTYLLLARLEEEVTVTVGRLGTFVFPAGWYAYAGSALGPGGIPARLARHWRSQKRAHWHIDYLLAHGTPEASWYVETVERLECRWAAAVRTLPGARLLVPRFGASDCRCPGHLAYLPRRPPDREIAEALASASPGGSDPPGRWRP
jgi:Uri superfamily endonuclease